MVKVVVSFEDIIYSDIDWMKIGIELEFDLMPQEGNIILLTNKEQEELVNKSMFFMRSVYKEWDGWDGCYEGWNTVEQVAYDREKKIKIIILSEGIK